MRLRTQGLDRQRDALLTERKPLVGGLEVMERERSRLPVISAENALASRLFDEQSLQTTSVLRHGLRAAAPAAVK